MPKARITCASRFVRRAKTERNDSYLEKRSAESTFRRTKSSKICGNGISANGQCKGCNDHRLHDWVPEVKNRRGGASDRHFKDRRTVHCIADKAAVRQALSSPFGATDNYGTAVLNRLKTINFGKCMGAPTLICSEPKFYIKIKNRISKY